MKLTLQEAKERIDFFAQNPDWQDFATKKSTAAFCNSKRCIGNKCELCMIGEFVRFLDGGVK